MLVLTREKDQRIIIGDNIIITVLDVRRGNKVRLGIEAPHSLEVDRMEIREEKRIRRAMEKT